MRCQLRHAGCCPPTLGGSRGPSSILATVRHRADARSRRLSRYQSTHRSGRPARDRTGRGPRRPGHVRRDRPGQGLRTERPRPAAPARPGTCDPPRRPALAPATTPPSPGRPQPGTSADEISTQPRSIAALPKPAAASCPADPAPTPRASAHQPRGISPITTPGT